MKVGLSDGRYRGDWYTKMKGEVPSSDGANKKMKKLLGIIFVTVLAILALDDIKAFANEVRIAYGRTAVIQGETTEDDLIRSGMLLEKVSKKKSRIYLGDEVLASVSFKKNENGEKVVDKVILDKDYLDGIFYFKNAPKYDRTGANITRLYPEVLTLSTSRTSTEFTFFARAAEWEVNFKYSLKTERCECIFFQSSGWTIKISR